LLGTKDTRQNDLGAKLEKEADYGATSSPENGRQTACTNIFHYLKQPSI
jgi:hypothetical protein